MRRSDAPIGGIAGDLRASMRLAARNARVLRRTWWVPVFGMLEPFLYLAWIAVGVGPHYIGGSVDLAGAPSYPVYVATAMVAVSVMNGAVYESSLNVYYRRRYAGTYRALVSTPLDVRSISLGEIVTAGTRGVIYGVVALAVLQLWGVGVSLLGYMMALLCCVATGFTFASIGLLAATCFRSWDDAEYLSLFLLPMFLFSSTFFPVETLPAWARTLVDATPLIHAVRSIRASVLHARLELINVGDLVYLVLLGLVALYFANANFRRDLLA